MAAEDEERKGWKLIGYCDPCDNESKFIVDWNYSNGIVPNYRERLVCEHCGLNNRQRFMAGYLKNLLKESGSRIKHLYLYEQVTSFYKSIKEKENLWPINIIGSEYLGVRFPSGKIINGIRHEDALNLSFNDNSFDLIISNDVYEHVPDINQALREVFRITRKGGRLFFTVPFYVNKQYSEKRAALKRDKVVHFLPEQYHGNPVDENGSLVFYDFGWDILDIIKQIGFKDARMVAYYSFFYGYLGDGLQFIFEAEK